MISLKLKIINKIYKLSGIVFLREIFSHESFPVGPHIGTLNWLKQEVMSIAG
jgi:hypothetical protein